MLKFIDLNNLIVALAVCLVPVLGMAQEPADTLAGGAPAPEEENTPFRPEAVRLGVDVSHLVGNVVDPDRKFYEVNTDVSFGKYLLSADWGTGSQHLYEEGLDYQVSGNYFRIGPDVNFIPENLDWNAFFVGLRFGLSSFDEKLTTTFFVPGWDTLSVTPDRHASAHWFEGVGGLKARVWKGLYMGYTLRFKFGIRVHDDPLFTPYHVPGFGKVGDGSRFSFSYHLMYRIPFRQQKGLVSRKK